MDVGWFLERKTVQHCTEKTPGGEAIGDEMRRGRLRWHGYVERKDDYVKACIRLVVEGKAPVGRHGRRLCMPTCVF